MEKQNPTIIKYREKYEKFLDSYQFKALYFILLPLMGMISIVITFQGFRSLSVLFPQNTQFGTNAKIGYGALFLACILYVFVDLKRIYDIRNLRKLKDDCLFVLLVRDAEIQATTAPFKFLTLYFVIMQIIYFIIAKRQGNDQDQVYYIQMIGLLALFQMIPSFIQGIISAKPKLNFRNYKNAYFD